MANLARCASLVLLCVDVDALHIVPSVRTGTIARSAAASFNPIRSDVSRIGVGPRMAGTFAAFHTSSFHPSHTNRARIDLSVASMDGTLGAVSWLIIFVYQQVSKRLTAKWSSQNGEARAVWTRYILEKGDYILGVQTLRNALTSASFFATACFTTLSIIIGAASRGTQSTLALVKYGVTSILLIGAALSYLQSVRYMNTCAFLFQVANDQRDETCSRGTVMLLMVLSQNCWAAGTRAGVNQKERA